MQRNLASNSHGPYIGVSKTTFPRVSQGQPVVSDVKNSGFQCPEPCRAVQDAATYTVGSPVKETVTTEEIISCRLQQLGRHHLPQKKSENISITLWIGIKSFLTWFVIKDVLIFIKKNHKRSLKKNKFFISAASRNVVTQGHGVQQAHLSVPRTLSTLSLSHLPVATNTLHVYLKLKTF